MTMPAGKIRYVVQDVSGWFYTGGAYAAEGPGFTDTLAAAKDMNNSGAVTVRNMLAPQYPDNTFTVVPVLEAVPPAPRGKPPKYIDGERFMLSLVLIVLLHSGNAAQIRVEVQDLVKRVPYERRAKLRSIVQHRDPEAVLRQFFKMYALED